MGRFVRKALPADAARFPERDKDGKEYIYTDFLVTVGWAQVLPDKDDGVLIRYGMEPGYEREADEREFLAALKEEIIKESGMEKITVLGREGAISGKEQKKKPRESGLELLRIFSMCMVIILHYLSKGGLLKDLAGPVSVEDHLLWLLESMSLVCVNVYVIISGYFSVESRFSLHKLAKLWCEIFFYSVGIAIVCFATGVADLSAYKDIYSILFFVFPVVNGHYWFATAYLVMYLFTPVLGSAIRSMDQKTHGISVLILLAVYTIPKSILPFELGFDDKGNGVIWFLILFLSAAYLRKYGLAFLEKGKNAWIIYISSVLLICLSEKAFSMLNLYRNYEYGPQIPMHYNFIFVFTGAAGLFYCFKNIKIKEGGAGKVIRRIASTTFGVYLLHEHLLLRYRWIEWLNVKENTGMNRALHILLCVVLIFTVGAVADLIRQALFYAAEKVIDKCMKLYFSAKEGFDYLIVGGLTTVLNWVVYVAFAYLFLLGVESDDWRLMISNSIAWVVSVLFAFVTNRVFVFHSDKTEKKDVLKEFLAFVSARVLSYVIEQILFYLLISVIGVNDLVSKLLIGVVVIALNYIFSKLWIFKKKDSEGMERKQ